MTNAKVEHNLLSMLSTNKINRVGEYEGAKELQKDYLKSIRERQRQN